MIGRTTVVLQQVAASESPSEKMQKDFILLSPARAAGNNFTVFL